MFINKKILSITLAVICFFNNFLLAKEPVMEDLVEKRIVVITGVSKGLGASFVKEFAQRGWKIAGCARSRSSIDQLQKEYGKEHLFSVVDVSNEDSVAKWSKEVLKNIGTPALLINNAAIINEPNPLWDVSPLEFKDVININVVGSFNVLHAFLPAMILEKRGVIVNMSSGWGQMGERLFGPYCASKFAIEGLTQSLAKELPKGLAVISLDPGGGINTDMLQKAYSEEANNFPKADQKAPAIVSYILKLKTEDNGKSLTVP